MDVTHWGPPPTQQGGKDGATKFWITFGIVCGVLLIVGQGVLLSAAGGGSPSRAAVGDCFAITDVRGTASNVDGLQRAKAEKAECSRADAIYRVAQRLSDTNAPCPTDSYSPYVQKGLGSSFKLCLGYNVATGDCFEESDARRAKIPCSTKPGVGRIKVLKVVEGTASEAACDSLKRDDIFAGVYPLPEPQTICFTALGGGVPRGTNL